MLTIPNAASHYPEPSSTSRWPPEETPVLNDGQSAAASPAPQAQRDATTAVASFGACPRYPVVLMSDNPDAKPDSGQSPEGRLDSWKEIAVYLGRGIRTVQR